MVSLSLANARTYPVTGYVSQLLGAPPEARSWDRWAANKLLHVPANVFSHGMATRLKTVGLKSLSSLELGGAAALLRTATSKNIQYESLLLEMRNEAQAVVPMSAWAKG